MAANKDDSGIVMREDLKADEKPDEKSGSPKLVKLRSPSGAKVETSEENAETLRGAGYS